MAKVDLTAQRLRELLNYDPHTGIFTNRVSRSNRALVNAEAGGVAQHGYVRIWLGSQHYAHRLAWLYMYGEWPKQQIDHINGVRTDNRIANLRDISETHNFQNKRAAKSNSQTGVLGVSPFRGRYKATIKFNGKVHHLGTFDSVAEASAAYLASKRENHPGCTI